MKKFTLNQIVAFGSMIVVIFGTNGLNMFQINKMVTQEEFIDLKCKFIKEAKISAEKEKKQLLLIQKQAIDEPFQLSYIQDTLIKIEDTISEKKEEYRGNKCALQ
tara:strand:- start:316 stop:630 length:315 start_codon:yes stop_codon:yes gene_type:complete